jgi:hypothetical protein
MSPSSQSARVNVPACLQQDYDLNASKKPSICKVCEGRAVAGATKGANYPAGMALQGAIRLCFPLLHLALHA